MTQIKVEMTFDSVEALLQYFSQAPVQTTPAPTTGNPTPSVLLPHTTSAAIRSYSDREALTLPISMPSQSQTVTASLAPNPPQQEQDIASAVRGALDAMLQRLPSGTGAAKAHEILNKYGYKRTRDVADPAKAQSIIAEFKAA